MSDTFVFFIKYVCLITILLYIGSFFSYSNWFFDLSSNFKLQYGIGLFLLSILGWFLSKSRYFLISGCISMIIFVDIQPWIAGQQSVATTETIDVMGINLFSKNRDVKSVADYITTQDPDVIVLTEYTSEWKENLDTLKSIYPYTLEKVRQGNFGIGLLSKYPLQNDSIHFFVGGKYASVFGEVEINGKEIGILGTHPEPPFNSNGARLRNNQLQKIAEYFKDYQKPFVLVGDLNCGPYSYHFKKLLKGLQLSDTRNKFGILNTWPSTFFPLWVPIDHCLVNIHCKTINRENGPNIGSDHFPVFATIGF